MPYVNRPSILQRLVAAAVRPYDPANSVLNLVHQNRLQRISTVLNLTETRLKNAESNVHGARLQVDRRLGSSGQGVVAYDTSTVGSPTPAPTVTVPPLSPTVSNVTQTTTSSGMIAYTITGTAQNGSLLRVWNVPNTAANPGNGPIALDVQSGSYSGPSTPFSPYTLGAIAPAGAALQITAADPANQTNESTPVPVAATTQPVKPTSPTVTTVTPVSTSTGIAYTISGTAPAGSVLRVWATPNTAAAQGATPLALDTLAGAYTGPSTQMVSYTLGAIAQSGVALQITAADPTNMSNESAPTPVPTTQPAKPASPTVANATSGTTSSGQVVYSITGTAPTGSVLRAWITPNTAATPGATPLATEVVAGTYAGPATAMTTYSLGVVANSGIAIQITAADPTNLNNESIPTAIPFPGSAGSVTAGASISYSGSVSSAGQVSEALPVAARIFRFSAGTTVPVEGHEVNLEWVVSNAQSVAINGTSVGEYGTMKVVPTDTTTYTLEVQGRDGTQLTRQITLTTIPREEREAYFEIFSELGEQEFSRGRPKPESVNERLERRGFGHRPKEVIDAHFAEYRTAPNPPGMKNSPRRPPEKRGEDER